MESYFPYHDLAIPHVGEASAGQRWPASRSAQAAESQSIFLCVQDFWRFWDVLVWVEATIYQLDNDNEADTTSALQRPMPPPGGADPRVAGARSLACTLCAQVSLQGASHVQSGSMKHGQFARLACLGQRRHAGQALCAAAGTACMPLHMPLQAAAFGCCVRCVWRATGLTVLKAGLSELGLLDDDISSELDQVGQHGRTPLPGSRTAGNTRTRVEQAPPGRWLCGDR